jgi:D-alanine--poly(phosphoribitol) ligase subunit 1
MITFKQSFIDKLCQIERQNFSRNAIYIDGEYYTYQKLFYFSKIIASHFLHYDTLQIAILMPKNFYAYAGILACWLAGKTYVPLNCKESFEQIKLTLQLSCSKIIFVDENYLQLAQKLCANQDIDIVCSSQLNLMSAYYLAPKKVSANAYLMFTSGSSGVPKAVMIRHDQLKSFIDNIINRCGMNSDDRFSQLSELTFDFSIYEIFSCFAVGACLYVFPEKNFFALPAFIKQCAISFFACVPSVVSLMDQLKKIQENIFPSIRYSVFCGEALQNSMAQLWHQAAPNSIIDNLYGPTEGTVALTGYRWGKDCTDDVVPIGKPFKNQFIKIVDQQLIEVKSFETGELLISGSQIIEQYWQQSEFLSKKFINEDGRIWYKTGDLVCFDRQVGLIFKGRIDDQLKIRGYRVEKLEIESRIKKIAKTSSVAVVVAEDHQGIAFSVYIAFSKFSAQAILQKCRATMPDYMAPKKVFIVDYLPYNKNWKIDYNNLTRRTQLFSGYTDLEVYDADRQRLIKISLWYPTWDLPNKHCYQSHFKGMVCHQASIAPNSYPLLIISHGQGGHRFNQCYLAEFLSTQSYIVACVEHEQDNAFDQRLSESELNIYYRAKDVQFSINYLLNSHIALMIDVKNIFAAGHSIGATTIMALTGSVAKKNQYFQEENIVEPKIKAMMLMAPAQSDFFTEQSLKKNVIPSLLVLSGQDELLPNEGSDYLKKLNWHQVLEFQEAGHFVYLMECPPEIEAQCPEVCIDLGMRRREVHFILRQQVLRFFNELL